VRAGSVQRGERGATQQPSRLQVYEAPHRKKNLNNRLTACYTPFTTKVERTKVHVVGQFNVGAVPT